MSAAMPRESGEMRQYPALDTVPDSAGLLVFKASRR
jgi:hypothetical protein